MLHTQLVALMLAATALAATGCGKSSKTTSTANTAASAPVATTTAASSTTGTQTTPTVVTGETIKLQTGKPLSRTVWITRGDSICRSANLKRHSTTAKTPEDLARLLPQAAADDHIEARELSKLVPPSTTTSDWQQIVADMQKLSEYTDKASVSVEAKSISGASPSIAAGNSVDARLTEIAKKDGFKYCSQQ